MEQSISTSSSRRRPRRLALPLPLQTRRLLARILPPTSPLDMGRLFAARALLDFAYFKRRDPEHLRSFFHQLVDLYYDPSRRELGVWVQPTRPIPGPNWPWRKFQKSFHGRLTTIIRHLAQGRPTPVSRAARGLIALHGHDGHPYFYPFTSLPTSNALDAWVEWAVDMWFADITGLGLNLIGKCSHCGRYFLKLRPRRARFCSGSCRARASQIRHGYRPRRRRIPAPLHGTGGKA